MIKEIIIEWGYEPPGYFEEEMVVEHDGHQLRIDAGKIRVELDPKYADIVEDLIIEFSKDLELRFLAVQAMTHETFQLSKPSRHDVNKDGTRNPYIKLEPGTIQLSGGRVDFRHADANGNVVLDTKQERVNKKRDFSELAAKHGRQDMVLKSMLHSYSASVSDPGNELVHLYEVREAAEKRLGNASAVRGILGITKSEWSDFGRITCDEPLRQGRHRGQNFESLRDATPQELERVRSIALKIIERYLGYLTNQLP